MADGTPGRRKNLVQSITVKVAVTPALHANLQAMAVEFGWGNDPADVMRSLATAEVRKQQKSGRLPYKPLA